MRNYYHFLSAWEREGGNMWGTEQAWEGGRQLLTLNCMNALFILFGFGACEQITSLQIK